MRLATSILLAGGLAAALAGCNKEVQPAEEIRPVRFAVVGAGSVQSGDSYSGEIRARHETRLAFRVAGKVVQKLVNAGEHVKKGQPLARLDPTDYGLDLSAKQAQVAAAHSDLMQQETDLTRYRQLLTQSFVSQAQVDRQQNAVNVARAKLQQAEAQLSASSNQTAYTTLTADADGVVSEISAEPGLVVSAGQAVARLAQDGAREVAIQVPENAVARVRAAQEFAVTLWSDDHTFRGRLREIAGDTDPATRTYAARIALDEADTSALRLGMTARVQLPGSAAALRLPLTAILDQQGRHYVWVIDPKTGKVARREVKVGALDSQSVALQQGVARGERVVSAGVHLLREGQRVKLLAE